MRKVCDNGPALRAMRRTAPACLDREGDEAAAKPSAWQSHARKRNTADLLV